MVTILTNSPYAASVQNWLQSSLQKRLQLQIIPAQLSAEATRQQVRQVLQQQRYDGLIVDTFPRGLGGELTDLLPELSPPRVLIHRDLHPHYVQVKSITSFVQSYYQAVLIPGEGNDLPLAHLPYVLQTQPWLLRDASELATLYSNTIHSQSLELFDRRLLTDSPLILICAAGQRQEQEFFGHLTVQLSQTLTHAKVLCLSDRCPASCPSELHLSHYPGIDCLAMADLVIGAGGYNTVYECAALQVPLLAFAFERQYDRQLRRILHHAQWVASPAAAIEAARQLLPVNKPGDRQFSYVNGAVDAVRYIEQILSQRN